VEGLYTSLSEYFDLEGYVKWIALNFLVHNGDYCDAIFFYLDPENENTGSFHGIMMIFLQYPLMKTMNKGTKSMEIS
jgi:spore coat protein CotH